MSKSVTGEMKMSQLAEKSGIPPRTIRLYIARGLLEGPLRAGRGAKYGPAHLERLKWIRQMQRRGLTLKEIGLGLEDKEPHRSLPAPAAWWNYALAEDVVVSVRADAAPWRSRQIRKALARLSLDLEESAKQE